MAAWEHFSDLGFSGTYCEGGAVLLLIRAAALDVFSRLNSSGDRARACQMYTEAQLKVNERHIQEIAHAIEHANEAAVEENFEEIYSYAFVREIYPNVNPIVA